jgi:hypothetical protein
MPSSDSIGQRFTQLIQHLGLSKNAFAQSLDKTATVIQHLVDERNKPGYDLLCKVFDTYPNVSKDWLLQGDGPMLKTDGAPVAAAHLVVEPAAPLAAVTSLFAVAEPPAAAAPLAPLPTVPVAPVAAASVVPITPPPPAPEVAPVAAVAPAATIAPLAAPLAAPAPDPAYFTVALQTQYLQHQLALAEQRNQHLLEQQALMQQMVALLQRTV